jgi:sulfate/thiosulfate transport system substrate-binding protein
MTSHRRQGRARTRSLAGIAIGAMLLGALPMAATAQDASPPSFETTPGALTLVGYTTPREAYAEIIPLFQATEAGAGVQFEESYGPSGDQSRAVSAGLPADVVALALWPDVERLVEPGIVSPDWDDDEHKGIVHNSVVSFAVRPGNPKGITTWDDLVRDDIVVITPNPLTSGGAQWNILAAYQAQIDAGKSEEEAIDYLRELASHVAVWDRGARDALTTFLTAGQGDVLIAYENEAIFAQQQGQPLELIIPPNTLLIENAVAATLTGDAPDAAAAFVDFLYTPEAQAVFGRHGFRPEVEEVAAQFSFPQPANLATVDEDLGGWAEARPRFFDPDTGIMAEIFRELGLEA